MRDCDKCEGTGVLQVAVTDFDDRPAPCWKCGGSGILPEPALVNPSAFEMDFHADHAHWLAHEPSEPES